MGEKESRYGTVEYDNLYVRIVLYLGDDAIEHRDRFRTEDIERWMVNGDAPVSGGNARNLELLVRTAFRLRCLRSGSGGVRLLGRRIVNAAG